MKLALYLTPLDAPLAVLNLDAPKTIADVLAEVDAGHWFADGGKVLLDGVLIAPDTWATHLLQPSAVSRCEFVYVPQSKKTLLLIASVAVVAIAAFVSGGALGPAGLGLLGSSFAAGGIGASLAGAAIGIAGSLAISALTAPPKVADAGSERALQDAGVTGNTLTLLDVLPVVLGKIGFSPPLLAPPYTTLDGEDVTLHMIVGCEGRNLIENIRINDVDAANVAGLSIETVESTTGSEVFAAYPGMVIEERNTVALGNFQTELASQSNDLLTDQTTPDNSAPDWHYFQTAGSWDEYVLRFLFPSGMVDTSNNSAALMPARIEVRKVGDVAWRALPTVHFADYRVGYGPMRAEVRLKRQKQPGGRHFSNADGEYPITELNNKTGIGQSFEYSSDPYFQFGVVDAGGRPFKSSILPIMTGTTTGSVTITASSAKAAKDAWRVSDSWNTGVLSNTSYWSPADNTLPGAWLQVEFSSAVEMRSYLIASNFSTGTPTTAPTKWTISASNDGVSFIQLGGVIDASSPALPIGVFQVDSPASYTHYRWTFLENNGAANTELRVCELLPYTTDCMGTALGVDYSSTGGLCTMHTASYESRCIYGSLDKNGATFYLDPDQWPEGPYDIRVKRGTAMRETLFLASTYAYNGSSANADFFEYRNVSGKYKIFIGQKNLRSDCSIEAVQTKQDVQPFTQSGLSVIAMTVPNLQVSSVYGEFTSYAPVFDGTIWPAEEVPTQNPAALYRKLLLGGWSQSPVPGESIDEDGLAAWFTTCAGAAHVCNAVLQGARIDEAKQMLASAGYASPRNAEVYGVIEDKDTSALPVRYAITPLNSQSQGDTLAFVMMPDAIRAEFQNQDLKYAVDHLMIYRDGKTEANAKRIDRVTYTGITDSAKITARASFDLRQAVLRQQRFVRKLGLDGFLLKRGDVVMLWDDVVDRAVLAGFISAVTSSGGFITALTLDNIMPWSAGGDLLNAGDMLNMGDFLNPSEPMGLAIEIPGSDVVQVQVTDVTDSNTCTLTTPLADDGSIVPGLMVGAGPWGRIGRRVKVMSIRPNGFEERTLELADEAIELFT